MSVCLRLELQGVSEDILKKVLDTHVAQHMRVAVEFSLKSSEANVRIHGFRSLRHARRVGGQIEGCLSKRYPDDSSETAEINILVVHEDEPLPPQCHRKSPVRLRR